MLETTSGLLSSLTTTVLFTDKKKGAMKTSSSTCVHASLAQGGLRKLALAIAASLTLTATLASAASTPSLTAFSEESVISLDKIDSVTQANFSPDVLAAIQAGAQEIHQQVNYDPSSSTISVNAFL